MMMQDLINLETAHTSGVYPKRPLAIVRGQGAHLWDADGREYIDCVGGQGAANLGHAHPRIVEALQQQSACLISCPEIFYNDRRAELLARLSTVAPEGLDHAFLCNSGTKAVEAAIKFARLSTGRTRIVAAIRGFHGRTMGALSATWNREYRAPFRAPGAGLQPRAVQRPGRAAEGAHGRDGGRAARSRARGGGRAPGGAGLPEGGAGIVP